MTPPDAPEDFSKLSSDTEGGLLRETWHWLRHNKKYWLIPVLIMFLLLGILIVVGGSSAAPFIYRLF